MRWNDSLTHTIDWPASVTGVIIKKAVVEGMQMKVGEEIFRIADLSSMWIVVDVAEQDIGQVKVGSVAKISFRAFPGKALSGKGTFILHELEMSTRSRRC